MLILDRGRRENLNGPLYSFLFHGMKEIRTELEETSKDVTKTLVCPNLSSSRFVQKLNLLYRTVLKVYEN